MSAAINLFVRKACNMLRKMNCFFVTKYEKPRCKVLESNCNIGIIGIHVEPWKFHE